MIQRYFGFGLLYGQVDVKKGQVYH